MLTLYFTMQDIISLLIQTGGASIVAGTDDPSKTKLVGFYPTALCHSLTYHTTRCQGSNIMLTGIIFQLCEFSLFLGGKGHVDDPVPV